MAHIRVNPERVRGYGRQAQGIFEAMHQSLVALCLDRNVQGLQALTRFITDQVQSVTAAGV